MYIVKKAVVKNIKIFHNKLLMDAISKCQFRTCFYN